LKFWTKKKMQKEKRCSREERWEWMSELKWRGSWLEARGLEARGIVCYKTEVTYLTLSVSSDPWLYQKHFSVQYTLFLPSSLLSNHVYLINLNNNNSFLNILYFIKFNSSFYFIFIFLLILFSVLPNNLLSSFEKKITDIIE